MTDLRCPLCEAVLHFPPGPDPRAFMDVLSQHFSESCTAIRVMAPPLEQPPPRPRHEQQD